mmetsp:Transcript_9925/g.23506  ORF Transcript_9925/g.23506 Transcript_9925/m.23506 type:complete len:392 (-) Transcript_9925:217-1392(-)
MVLHGEGLLTDDGLHGHNVLAHGVRSIELVGHRTVVATGHALSDGRLHQTRQRRKDVDWGEDALGVQLTVEVDLSLGNVASKIGDRMSNIVVGHGKDGELGDRTVAADDTSGTLVDGGKIGVHVAGVTTTAGNLLTGGGNLAERIGVGGHVGEDDQDVKVALVGKVLGRGEGKTGGNDTLDGGIVGEVEEKGRALHGTGLLEIGAEETGGLHVDTHGTEDDGEVLLVSIDGVLLLDEGGLAGNLGGDLVVGKTGGGEDRDLLSTSDGVHDVDGGDTGLDHGLGVVTGGGVDGLSVDVEVGLRHDLGRGIDDLAGSVEGSAKHFLGNSHLQNVAGEFAVRLAVVNAGRTLENLNDGAGTGNLKDLTGTLSAISKAEVDNLSKLGELHIVQNH